MCIPLICISNWRELVQTYQRKNVQQMTQKKTEFTPVGEGGSGRSASATGNTQHFGRLNIETDIFVQSQLIKLETSGRFGSCNILQVIIRGFDFR